MSHLRIPLKAADYILMITMLCKDDIYGRILDRKTFNRIAQLNDKKTMPIKETMIINDKILKILRIAAVAHSHIVHIAQNCLSLRRH